MPEIVNHRESWPAGSLPQPEVESVVDRLARLEQSLASLQNPEVLEQALTQRILQRLQQHPQSAGLAPMLPPLSVADRSSTTSLPFLFEASSGIWAKIPILAELRLMLFMYLDPRYRLSRVCQFGVPIVLMLIVINFMMFNFFFAIPLLGLILERVGLVILAVVLYKILAREAARYAAVLDYIKRYGLHSGYVAGTTV